MKRILEFFQDANGDFSAVRLCMIWVVILVTVYFFYTLFWLKRNPITFELTGLVSAVFGFKSFQGFGEYRNAGIDKKL